MKKFLVLLCSFVVALNSVVFADQINLYINNKAARQNEGVTFQLNGEAYCELTNLNCDNFTITVTNTGKKTCTVTAHKKNGATEINGYGDLLALGWDTITATKLCELKVSSGKTKTWVKNLTFHGKNRVYIKMTKGDSCFVKVSGGLATYGGTTSNQQSNQIQNNTNNTAKPTTVVPKPTTTPQRQTTTAVKNGWVQESGRWRYYTNGVMSKNRFIRGNDGYLYYVNSSGNMWDVGEDGDEDFSYDGVVRTEPTTKNKYLVRKGGRIVETPGWHEISIVGKYKHHSSWVYVLNSTGDGNIVYKGYTPDGYYIGATGKWKK